MKVINYFESGRQDHWLEQIRKSDWGAGAFLYELLSKSTFFDTVGKDSKVLLLTDADALVSFCTYAEKDDVQPTDLTPWVGFVYTFPQYRGHHYVGLLLDEVERLAKAEGLSRVFISTNHVGLYEKYGCEYFTQLKDIEGNPSRIYVKRIPAHVEKAGIMDIDALVDLRLAYLSEDHGHLDKDVVTEIRINLPKYFQKHLNYDLLSYVVRVEDDIVACAFLLIIEKPMSPAFLSGKTGTVLNVYTKPDHRGKGYARSIMEAMIRDARKLGLSSIELKSTEDGYNLYKTVGFEDDRSKYHLMKWKNP